MILGITGTPGTGKTTIAAELGELLGAEVWNEKQFSLKQGIGEYDSKENGLVVPLEELEKRLNSELKDNVIVEGHLICEIKANFDFIIVLRCHPEILELRLEQRNYSEEKVQDNVFCEGIDYCLKHSKRNYEEEKIIEIENRKSIKETVALIIKEIQKRKEK